MKDLTGSFDESLALAQSLNWSDDKAIALARAISACVPGSELDWDSSVPEQWSRILKPDEQGKKRTLAAVLMSAPFVLVRDDISILINGVRVAKQPVICAFDDWDSQTLMIDRLTLEKHFNADLSHSPVNFSAMSPNDLYFATVIL
jgi:hypothetical protein